MNGVRQITDGDELGATRALLDQLLADSKIYKSTDDYKSLLAFIARLRNVAPFNAMLLQLQKPGLTYAASAYDWAKRFNREIKEDARPLLILWPFGPVATVYDVLDTFDPLNPEVDGLPANISTFFAAGEITERQMKGFRGKLVKKRIDLRWVDEGDASAGRILVKSDGKDDKDKHYIIKLNHNHTTATQFTTLAHELGHLFLGHLGPNKLLSAPMRRRLSKADEEIEAESVAYLVCERNGVKTKSESYLANFATGGLSAADLDLYRITHAAGHVESILGLTKHTQFPPRSRR
ncbi:MAG: ImmA/IrrE family metallo-endopeptidase [bacterium]|nr:ImmA/IrrE family metallo-endopeptidase [bacterium]